MAPVPPEDITIGEVYRNLIELRKHIDDGFHQVHGRISGLSFVSQEAFVARLESIDQRFAKVEADVRELEESRQWMSRTVVAALVLPLVVGIVLAVILATVGVGGGDA